MQKLLYFLLFFNLFSSLLSAQNLLQNGSFEEKSQNPDSYAQVNRLYVWEDRMNTVNLPCTGGGVYFHSPDYCYGDLRYGGVCSSCIPDGEGYVGMYPYELIQQKLTTENHFRDAFLYKLSLQVRLPKIGNSLGLGWISNYEQFYLAVHFSKNRMKYQNEGNLNLLCKPEYMTLQNASEIVTYYIHLTKNEYSIDEWNKVEYFFSAPSPNYDWVGFEVIGNPELDYNTSDCDGNEGTCGVRPYTLIDDIQITNLCDFACNANTGEPQLKVEADHIGEGFIQVDWTTENNSLSSPWHNKLIGTWNPSEGTASLEGNISETPVLGIIANYTPIVFYLENANYAYLIVREWGDLNVYSDFGGLYYQELPYNACGYQATPECPLGAPLYFNGFGNNGNPIISLAGNYYWQLYYGNCQGDYVTGGNLWQGDHSGCNYNQIDPDSGLDCIDELPTTWDYYLNYDFTPCTLITSSNTQITSSTGFIICEGQPYVYPAIETAGEGSFTANWYHNGVLMYTTDQNTPQGTYILYEVGTYTVEIFTDVFCTNPIVKTVTVTECLGGENTSISSSKNWMHPYQDKVYLCENVCTNLSIETTSLEAYTAYWYKNDVLFYTNTEATSPTQTICDAGVYTIKFYTSQYVTEPLIKMVTVISQNYNFAEGYTVTNNNNTMFQNNTQILQGVLRITNNSTLLIQNATLKMSPNAHIIVERGSKLIVDNSTITSLPAFDCMTGKWGGIEVWGNTALKHKDLFGVDSPDLLTVADYENLALADTDPGMVVLKNNATLQNGNINTIVTDRSGGYYPNHYGGIVVADNATFLNCKKGVGFMAYRYENYSYLKNCRFVSNNDNLPNAKFEGITVWACKGIVVDNCTFDYQTTPEPTNTNARVGIIATDHQNLIVRNGCQFKQLQQGIQLGASNYLHGDATITDNLFSNNTAGITNLSTMQLTVTENTFAGNTPTQQGLTIGIALTGTCGYAISNNSFSNMLAGTAAWFTSHDTPGNNQIDCNTYTNCQWGNYLNDNNSGLQLINNDFATQTADNRLDKGTNNGAIAFSQGDFTTPYFNLFSTNPATQHFKANPTQTDLFVYFYHTDNINYAPEVNARLVPRCDITSNCTPPNNFVNVKIDFEGTYTGCLDLNGDGFAGMLPPNIDDCQTKECYYVVKSYLNNLKSEIDGGDKADLLNSIYNSPEALATYQKYMTASPYLSDEVLLQAAQAELMSPNYRANILLANAPLSDEIMYQIQDMVAANVYQLLYTIKYYTKFSARDNLNMSISSESAKKEKLLRTLIAKFADERDYAQLDEILTAENTTYAVRALLSSKIEREQFANAQTMLTYLPATTPDEQDYKTIQQINLQRLSATTQGFELSEQQYQALRNIAAAYGTQAPAAQTLLALLRGEYFEWQIPNETESSKTDTHPRYKDVALLGKEVLNRLSVTPNPANNSINVQLPNYLSEQPAVLNIYNLSGKLFATINTNKEQSTTTISTTDLPNGVYLISYTADGITLSSAKVVVQH